MSRLLERTQIVVKNGRPSAVILDIKKYEQLLNMLEDKEDAAEIRRIKKGRPSFKRLEEYLKNRA